MFIIWGKRRYGKMDAHEGQYAVTMFGHVWYLPLFPIESFWATREDGNGLRGHEIKLTARNVFAGYMRVWGILGVCIGAGVAAANPITGLAIVGASAGSAAWSWMQRSLRGDREKRRSDFHLVAYGTRCDPLIMSDDLAAAVKTRVEAAWAQVASGSTPEDIAKRGTKDVAQAVFAYGVLRLAARGGTHAAAAKAAADQILDSVGEVNVAGLEGGPYRNAAEPGAPR
jgi:hypothetical protein